MGRILFLSAVAFLAYRYIARSNKKHEEIVATAGNTEVLAPAPKEPAALVVAPVANRMIESSAAVEPHPRS